MIKCENVVKKYISTTAVDGINIEIEGGKVYALLGPNGSGKTTLMKMIAGLAKPTSGVISLDGKPLDYKDKARIAYMPTEGYFFDYMNCEDVGHYYADFFEDFSFERYMKLLKSMDLDEKKKAKEMSSGMMAKLKIVATLSRNADLVMLDEPLNGIDIIARDKIISAIEENIESNQAVVMSSHLVDELEKIVDEVIFIKDGKCILAGNAEAIRNEKGKSIVDIYKEIYAY